MRVYQKATLALAVFLLISVMNADFVREEREPQGLLSSSPEGCAEIYNLSCGGRSFYINPTHHVASLENPNTALLLKNAVRYVSPYMVNPISVLVFANALDRAQAIFGVLSGEPDIAPVMTTNQNDLLSLTAYDVVIVHSNGFNLDLSVEQSIADFRALGGGVIGSHDIIWQQHNNPVMENMFGATARGDGSVPGSGWIAGTVTVLKSMDHNITAGVADSWSMVDEQYYFDVEFTRRMLVLLETNHGGNLIPVAWTLAYPPIGAPINLDASVVGGDIFLDWEDPDISRVEYHLIYRAPEPDSFDFGSPIHNTSGDADPLKQNWLDIGAAEPSSPREYYYIVRAVNDHEVKSPTSLTVGKWTKHLVEGANSISLPLGPLVDRSVSWYSSDIPGVKTFDWIDEDGYWVRYNLANPNPMNDTMATMGMTFQVVLQQQTHYTFIGRPGTMIWFTDRLGSSESFRSNLTLEIQGDSVALSWASATNVTRYNIYRTTDRESLYDLIADPIATTASTSYRDVNVLDGFSGELYYTVIPEDDYCGLGSSTYSRGVVKKTFHSGSQSFALELKPLQEHLLSWYTSAIDGTVGIVYMVKSYWRLHAWEMPPDVYDTIAAVSEGYQILVEKESSSFVYLGN
ncbi:MAG: ThuA domain-containing protein [Methanobacteriota archaeon]|nr:MAG: ThuA domain-containing protein [Euryarchaeota archaeon]